MTTAYWCILAVIMMPYIFAPMGQLPGLTYEGFKEPRRRWPDLAGWKARANSTHLNGLEIIPGFAAAVIIAHLANVPQGTTDTLALTFVGTRILHAAFYIANLALLRTFAWASGVVCIVALFVHAA
ncbi:MAG: MAPEG family protein [Chromatiales bacterium]|nr:MAPEG family protein [Rhodospirillales bacterium]MDH3932561.1 MAPEG family protein [Chromatiales bacterium]MDH3967960.1 MAPEG family protein [Rhodospirillales bacterium]